MQTTPDTYGPPFLQEPRSASVILQRILATSWYLTLWHHKPPLVVCFLSLLYFNLMLMLNFMVRSLKPPHSGLLSPFCITGRKSPGNPQTTMDPTTGTNCQIQIPSHLTLPYWLFPNRERENSGPLHLLSSISHLWLWAPTVWSLGFLMEGRLAPWGGSLLCSPFCWLKG